VREHGALPGPPSAVGPPSPKVGEGAFGVVHRASQPQVGREVAVKVVRPSLANDPEFICRFEAEAQLVARLEHPHIVPLYDYWRELDGAYLVMRLMRGGSLRDALEGGPLSFEAALLVVDHVGSALASAHRQGVVHRDVKPGNILFDEEGNAFLSDFGIARDVSTARTPERAAATTTSAGYVSPGELRGEESTTRADVSSLGRVLHAMVDGELPAGVEAIVRRATSTDPGDRYADASALVAALAGAGAAPPAAPAVPAGPARNP
jgi:serine/threonine protein kinase